VIGGRRSLQGRKPGDRRVRVDRPHSALFRWTGPGQLTAKDAAFVPPTAAGRAWSRGKALLLGRPLASEEEIGERLSKKKALAIFSSDALTSSAYATEEILRVLILGGAAALAFGIEVSIAISLLLAVVAIIGGIIFAGSAKGAEVVDTVHVTSVLGVPDSVSGSQTRWVAPHFLSVSIIMAWASPIGPRSFDPGRPPRPHNGRRGRPQEPAKMGVSGRTPRGERSS
jgi:hypothetical protein